MKINILMVLVFTVFGCTFSQTLNFNSVKTLTSNGKEYIVDMYIDKNNNMYTIGTFNAVVDFDDSPGTSTLSTTSTDIFIRKNDASGNLLWVKQIGGNGEETVGGFNFDNYGNMYIVGSNASLSIDFDPSPVTSYTVAATTFGRQMFVLKLSSEGDFKWVNLYGGYFDDYAIDIKNDLLGNVYFAGTITDYTPVGSTTLNPSNGHAILVKLDSLGNFNWVKQTGGGSSETVYAIDMDKTQNIYMTGSITNGATYTYYKKYSNAGTLIWSKSNLALRANDLVVDTINQKVYLTGLFNGTVDFDSGSGVSNLTASSSDAFILKTDTAGNFIWAKNIGSPNVDIGIGIKIDSHENVYSVGTFKGICDFDPSAANTFTLNGGSSFEVYISKLNSNGDYISANQIGAQLNDEVNKLEIDKNDCIYILGAYKGTVDFDLSTGSTYTLTADASNTDAFLVKYCDGAVNVIENKKQQINYTIYPNPAKEILNIKLEISNEEKTTISISNILGEVVSSSVVENTNSFTLNTNSLKSGIYFVTVSYQGKQSTKKLIID
ncbi:MAG: T9SS type A sorting domain-containing protein [Bacteroidia bacterium]